MLGEELPIAQYMGGGAGVEVVVAQSYYDTQMSAVRIQCCLQWQSRRLTIS